MLHLARFAIRRPKTAIALWTVFAAVLIAIGSGVEHRTSPTITVVPGTGSSHAQTLAKSKFGPSVLVPILLQGPARQLDVQGPKLVADLAKRNDTRVMSAWSTGAAGASLRPNRRAAMIVASVARSEKQMVKSVQAQIERTVARDISAPVRASVTGQPTLDKALKTAAIDTTRRAVLIAIPILFVLLLLMLRSPWAAGVISVFGATTALAGFGVMALLGTQISVDATALALAAMTGLALGVGYAMMLLFRYRQEETPADGRAASAEAATAAVMSSGRAILFAGTALLISLLLATALSSTVILTSLGIGVLLCAALAVGGAIAVLPAVLVLAGHHLDVWHPGAENFLTRGWERMVAVGDKIVAHPVPAGALATAALVVCAIPLFNMETGPPDITQLPASSQARKSFEEVGKVMGPGWATPYNVVVASDKSAITTATLLPAIQRLERVFASDRRVDSVLGPGSFLATQQDLKSLPKGLDQSAAVAKSSKRDLLKLYAGLGQAGAGAALLRSGLSDAANGAGQLNSGSSAATTGAGSLKGGLAKARAGANLISGGLKSALAGAISLRDGAAKALSGSEQLKAGLGSAQGPLNAGVPLANKMAADAASTNTKVDSASSQSKATSSDISAALSSVQGMGSAAKAEPGYDAAINSLKAAQASASQLNSTLSSASTTASSAASATALFASQTEQLAAGVSKLLAGSTDLAAGISQLKDGNASLAGGLKKLNGGGTSLTSGLAALEAGAGQLQTGLGQLTNGTGQLQSGLSSGVGPSGQLVAGLGTMGLAVAKARRQIPSTADLARLKKQSPGLFDSGYFVLAAIQGAPAGDQATASFAVNLNQGGNAGQIVVVPVNPANDPRTQALGTKLRRTTAVWAKANGVDYAVGGPAGELADFNSSQRAKIGIVIPVIALAITLMLMLALRAVLLPIAAVLLDLLAVAAGFGVLSFLFVGSDPILGGPGYLDPMSIIGIFSVVFGLTATYEVLLLMRTRELFVVEGDSRGSLRKALRSTAAAATGAGVAMAAAVIPFATTDLITVRQFGIGVAVVILIDAFIIRPILLPAAVAVLGDKAWWPTKPKSKDAPEGDAPQGSGRFARKSTEESETPLVGA